MPIDMDSPTSEVRTESRAARKPKRNRVLRTYGKRTSTSEPPQPTPKRRCIEDINKAIISNDEAIESTCDAGIPPSPILPPVQPIRKGTIMSYFNVVSSSSRALNSSEPSSEPVDPINTPPSSPPMPTLPRKNRRRLTTRITSRATSEESNAGETIKKDGEKERTNDVDIGSSMLSTGSAAVLSEVSSEILNLPVTEQTNLPDIKKCERSTKKASKPATVQTTLSLSMEDKGFIECNECNMLYNPLHKQDAKCHARRHAAMLKAKSSIYDNNEILD
ncbi:hypothetical protein F5Y00DRAFT_159560 [Daldinia vernicosa]|uniref:uncharacterized protein n=1 Tax=Daldinia vernicosa TaxID=114800 RepID=UPI002007A159|nr:uncharacterized protein F5Y00DRAFT_159560 [Daldinia vernicosa]KAI0845924.1 hypothetical protein F5Y00DRAFT_159560 [Daldinia vernicosa]